MLDFQAGRAREYDVTAAKATASFVRAFKGVLLASFAASPLLLIAYLWLQVPADRVFHDHLAHELAIAVAVLTSAAVTYVAYRCYQASGEPALRWLTLGLLAMTIVYAPHGVMTRIAADNPPLFLLFGPASRFAMAALWLYAFLQLARAPEPVTRRPAAAYWALWTLGLALFTLLVLRIAADPALPRAAARYVFEGAAIVFNLLGLAVLLRHIRRSPLLSFFALALCFFIASSLAFLLGQPWNHMWWLAHLIFASGFLLMSYGLARAFLATGRLVGVFSEEQLMRQLEAMATTDELTQIPNRRAFMLRFAEHTTGRDPQPFAVILMDLDNFKVINDSLGHDAGDALLTTLSRRLMLLIRGEDTLARLGGDEFAVLVPGVDDEAQAGHAAERLFSALEEPLLFKGRQIQPKASMGIALFPVDGKTPGELLKAADSAMYESKRRGRQRYSFHTPEMNARARSRMELEHDLQAALREDQFRLHYQPQIDLRSGQICGAEALLRWDRPGVGMVSAADFITTAEQSGLIHELGVWVIRRACADLSRWRPLCRVPFRLAVNLSGHQLVETRLADRILEIIDQVGLQQGQLAIELEVTESTLMKSTAVIEALHQLRAAGVQLAIDDFGTGYSSLAQLNRLPLDRLKIAGSFIARMLSDRSSESIVRAIIGLALDLDLVVLAEGVEEARQEQLLREAGCHDAQGYLSHRALSAPELESLLRPLRPAA